MGGGASKGAKKPVQASDKLKQASDAAAAGKLAVAQKIFKEIDTNKNGKLSKEEITEAVKKYDANFIYLEPRPEYIIDNINNGLYR